MKDFHSDDDGKFGNLEGIQFCAHTKISLFLVIVMMNCLHSTSKIWSSDLLKQFRHKILLDLEETLKIERVFFESSNRKRRPKRS